MSDAYDFVVKRDDLRDTGVLPVPDEEEVALEPGQALLRIDNFSLSANNVTYGAMGDAMNYWDFFPAPEGWGRVPAWGFAEVTRSEHEGTPVGTRVYGYFPMSSYLVINPGENSPDGFTDVSPHRAALPMIYNRYSIVSEPEQGSDREALTALFSPLFATSFLLDDWLAEEQYFGAERLILSSASSKTALGLAFLLNTKRRTDAKIVGLTSPGNRDFVEGTGLYDEVNGYDDLTGLEPPEAAVYLDFAGSGELRARVHEIFGDELKASVIVGAADWESLMPPEGNQPLPGPDPGLFFAPDRAEKRLGDWGGEGLRDRVNTEQRKFIDSSGAWLTIRRGSGPDELGAAFRGLVEGETSPDQGWSIRP
ncbi:MAG: DUF2855 family protein [Solirubrobacterales bacterium]|nr:DUF2855 family protein [Solirubrobacterales bacterium]